MFRFYELPDGALTDDDPARGNLRRAREAHNKGRLSERTAWLRQTRYWLKRHGGFLPLQEPRRAGK